MCPATDRSRMARRRLPRPIYEPSGKRRSQRPESSGPRCACTCVMRASVSRSPQFATPLIPHIGLDPCPPQSLPLQFIDLGFHVEKLNPLKPAVDQAGNAVQKSKTENVFVKEER